MATQALATNGVAQAIEQVLVGGDLSRLSVEQRVTYYRSVCESLGLNELTRPFEYLHLNGKLILYARKDATDQLRSRRTVTIALQPAQVGDLYVVTARATLPDGRSDEEIGAVSTAGLRGDALANAMMKATTKAKRRVTLSICGLGMLDETEVETIPDARRHVEDEAPRAPRGPNLPESRLTAPTATQGPAEEGLPAGEVDTRPALEVFGAETDVRVLCANLYDEIKAAVPTSNPKLPAQDAPPEAWRKWLDDTSAKWAASEHNPRNKQPVGATQ